MRKLSVCASVWRTCALYRVPSSLASRAIYSAVVFAVLYFNGPLGDRLP